MNNNLRDHFGVVIQPDDQVAAITYHGTGALRADVMRPSPVVRLGRARVTIIGWDGNERAVTAAWVGVICRDGSPCTNGDFEGGHL